MSDFQPTNLGYDVTYGRGSAREATPRDSGRTTRNNGKLIFRGQVAQLWINDVRTGFSISGSTAQSYRTRSYFAHHLVQPVISVQSQFPNQQKYADTIELIRFNHTTFDSSMTLLVDGHYLNYDVGNNQRGSHGGFSVEGYVKSVKRGHRRHEYAPSLAFDFVIERVIVGPNGNPAWADDTVTIRRLKDWNQIIQDKKQSGFQVDPDGNKPPASAPPRVEHGGPAQ